MPKRKRTEDTPTQLTYQYSSTDNEYSDNYVPSEMSTSSRRAYLTIGARCKLESVLEYSVISLGCQVFMNIGDGCCPLNVRRHEVEPEPQM